MTRNDSLNIDTTSAPNVQTVDALSPSELAQWCDEYLQASHFKDYCPNGLQVDAERPIRRIITGVTACEALIDAAIEKKADAILVHHGYFWKGEPQSLVGIKGRRIRKLLQNGISLLAYHLPLDAHPEIGNNAVLAQSLGLQVTGALYPHEQYPVGNITTCAPITSAELQARIQQVLKRAPLVIHGDELGAERMIKKVGICTGGAQDMLEQAAEMGCDAYISGEISERTTHSARELGIDYFASGHHATERGGIQALGALIQQQMPSLKVTFIDIDNPA
jgi:dinuclear metal center YbgI/SA1388 family protein